MFIGSPGDGAVIPEMHDFRGQTLIRAERHEPIVTEQLHRVIVK
jgi:hypothetical protein